MPPSPASRRDALARVFAAELRFRVRIAHRLDDGARAELADAVRRYALEIITIDVAKGVALAELAETLAPSFVRTLS